MSAPVQSPMQSLAVPGASYLTAADVTAAMKAWTDRGFAVLAPVQAASHIPDGSEVVANVVVVNPGDSTYDVDGKMALSKQALTKLAAGAGLDWQPGECRRLDDGRDPHFCTYQAVAHVTSLDGTTQRVVQSKTVDLRDDGPLVAEVYARNERKKEPRWKADAEVAQQRKFIAELAETKAMNRVIRVALGLPAAFPKGARPTHFVALKLVATGRFSDPVLTQEYARLRMLRDLGMGGGAVAALFGPRAVQAIGATEGQPTPATGSADADTLDAEFTEGTAAQARPATPPPAPAEPVAPPSAQAAPVPPVDDVIALAKRKGRLGSDPQQVTEASIRGWGATSPQTLARFVARLDAQPDVTQPGEWCPTDAEMPEWAR